MTRHYQRTHTTLREELVHPKDTVEEKICNLISNVYSVSLVEKLTNEKQDESVTQGCEQETTRRLTEIKKKEKQSKKTSDHSKINNNAVEQSKSRKNKNEFKHWKKS